ncbi:MAG: hypothetical protein QOK40_1948, partial [Miltoncostaeaceae bacterium]|nr:hypothetical protein [Miltoncostaeaceae bacterium]
PGPPIAPAGAANLAGAAAAGGGTGLGWLAAIPILLLGLVPLRLGRRAPQPAPGRLRPAVAFPPDRPG